MNKLLVKKVISQNLTAENLSVLLDKEKVEFHPIDQINWPDFPYCPSVNFRIAYTGKAILINYRVDEKSVRAKYDQDNGSVWTDSCAEFFVTPSDDGIYYNIESNCIGTVLVGAGKERNGREHATENVTHKIQRWSSLGDKPFDERIGQCTWELSLIIPFSVFYKHHIESFDGKEINANFYKCGDELQSPHFVSWNRIDIEKPDFHRPDFFGRLKFG